MTSGGLTHAPLFNSLLKKPIAPREHLMFSKNAHGVMHTSQRRKWTSRIYLYWKAIMSSSSSAPPSHPTIPSGPSRIPGVFLSSRCFGWSLHCSFVLANTNVGRTLPSGHAAHPTKPHQLAESHCRSGEQY